MKVLLSIKPEFAEKIFSGEKKYEFRRKIFKNKEVTTIVVYASSPVKKVIGEFEIERIVLEEIGALWKRTKKQAGITEDFFYSYFGNTERGYAIKVKESKLYPEPLCIKEHFGTHAPQSFMYLA